MKQINLSDETINQIKGIQEKYDVISLKLGYMEIRKKQIQEEVNELDSEYKSIRNEELTIINDLRKQHGEGDLDLDNKLYLVE